MMARGDEVTLEVLELLRKASTATLTTQLWGHGFRNIFLYGLRPLNLDSAHFVGRAYTLRFIPARHDLTEKAVADPAQYAHRVAVESVGEGEVLVVDCRGVATAGTFGSMILKSIQNRGAVAVVSDGAIRDSHIMAKSDFPVYVGGNSPTPSLTVHHAIDFQVPIACAGVAVLPGDVLVGDQEGVVVIPQQIATLIAQDAAEQEEREAFLYEKLQAGASIEGIYPPSEETLAEFERVKAERARAGQG